MDEKELWHDTSGIIACLLPRLLARLLACLLAGWLASSVAHVVVFRGRVQML